MAPARKKPANWREEELKKQSSKKKRDYMSSYAKAHNLEGVQIDESKDLIENIMENTVNTTTENTASTSGLTESKVENKDFKMPEQAEKTLDLYLSKVEEYYNEIGKEKTDIVNQKSKVLEAVLNTDMLKID